jgi:hypothetical protein
MLEESGAQRWPDLPDNRPRSTSDGERESRVPPNTLGPGEPVASRRNRLNNCGAYPGSRSRTIIPPTA